MRKIKGVISFIIGIFVFCMTNIVFADGFTTLSGGDTASTGEKIDFTIGIKSETEAIEFEANLKYDNTVLELINITNEEKWMGSNSLSSTGNNSLKFTSSAGTIGESSVVTIKFKVKENVKGRTTISLDGIQLTSRTNSEESSNTILTDQVINKDIIIKSDDNTLKSIKVDNKMISGFSSTLYEYSMEVDSLSDKIQISAVLNDEKTAKLVEEFGNREVELKYGQNKVLVKAESESGKVLTYTLNIFRKDDRVVNNDLNSIIINGGTVKINFEKSILSYTIKAYKLDRIEVEAISSDTEATVEVDAPKTPVIGENKIKITVTAVTGDKKTYSINIINGEEPTDTRLKNLAIKGININFKSDTYKYTIRYDKRYKDGLDFYEPTTFSDDVEVQIIDNTNLKENSSVKVMVNALDGSSTSEYLITLEKDNRINFFFIVDIVIGLVLVILIIIQLNKRKKLKKKKEEEIKEKELEKTKELKL